MDCSGVAACEGKHAQAKQRPRLVGRPRNGVYPQRAFGSQQICNVDNIPLRLLSGSRLALSSPVSAVAQ